MVCTGVVRSWLHWHHQHKSLLLMPMNKKSHQSPVNRFINPPVEPYSPHTPYQTPPAQASAAAANQSTINSHQDAYDF
jgi:hypothetical protein